MGPLASRRAAWFENSSGANRLEFKSSEVAPLWAPLSRGFKVEGLVVGLTCPFDSPFFGFYL